MTRAVQGDSSIHTASPDAKVAQRISTEKTVSGTLGVLADGYAERAALAWRTDDAKEWRSLDYATLWRRVRDVAAGLRDVVGVSPGDMVAVLGFTSPDYVAVDFAISGPAAAISVPLQTTAPESNWRMIVDETQARVIAVSASNLDALVAMLGSPDTPGVEHIVVFDTDTAGFTAESSIEKVSTAYPQLQLHTLDDIEAAGPVRRAGSTAVAEPAESGDPDRTSLLIYTSGSTGTPKGAIYSQAAVVRMLHSGFGLPDSAEPNDPWITLNFMPMSHVMGRSTLSQTLGNGGTAYFTARSDLSTLLEDLAAVQPTQLHFVPRVWEMIYQEYIAERATPDDVEALQQMRHKYFGDRPVHAITGSAPISDEVADFVGRMLGAPLIEGYGSTEAGGVIIDGRVARPPVIDFKLVDVPELGYLTSDRPHPRGELLVKTTDIFGGYYQRPQLNAEVFDDDGYYRTGDIMAETGPDQLRYLDRRNNVIKLSQGEFVTISNVEAALTTPPIRQLYLYGNSSRSYLLAVAVPTPEAIDGAAGDDAALRRKLNTAIREIADRAGLASAEIPRDIIVETTPFSQDSGLLTGIGKLARPQLRDKYRTRLESLYVDLDAGRDDLLRAAREQVADRPVIDTVTDVVAALLDLQPTELEPTVRFTDLGGDSLSAVTLGTTLRDIFDVEVPVSLITSPTTDLARIAAHLSDLDTPARPTAQSVHGQAVLAPDGEITADQLTLDAFLDHDLLDTAASIAAAPAEPSTVLVTGATGFLGRYLLLEWLRRVDLTGGTVIALVRAADAETGRRRLDATFDTGDADLAAEFGRLADAHLRVVAGDKDAYRLGLDEPRWQELAASVDLIVDPAALVNHVLPYRELFGPNVVGTAELIRLALTTVRKPLVYISTVGVGAQIDDDEFIEDADVRDISARRRVDAGYASGYGNSKWAGEVLLRDAHERFGLPVTVFRCDMILADGTDLGQLNLPDMFTRLIMSVAATGLAPKSFHPLDADGSPTPSHYDALPVDFLAAAICELRAIDGFRTYHAMNPHEDGIGLDTYVDWMIDDGENITRIEDYDEWYRDFVAAVEALPEQRRRRSLLPIIDNYATPSPATTGGIATAEKFREAVREAKVGPDKDIPHISREIIGNYVRSLRHVDLI